MENNISFQAQSKTFDGSNTTITVTPFTGSIANKMLVRFQQSYAGKTISCSPDEWQKFCEEFLQFTSINGVSVGSIDNFNRIFMSNLMLLFQAIEFASEVNFGKDFLGKGSKGGTIQSQKQEMTIG